MRRKRFQRGSLRPRKRKGKVYWYAQWREYGQPRSRELGLCCKVTRVEAETMLAAILQPINEGIGQPKRLPMFTFRAFVNSVYLPIFREKWKTSTAITEEERLEAHLVRTLEHELMTNITREQLQGLLNKKAEALSRSVVDHLRFRLRSIFEVALSEGVVERNPTVSLFTPRHCKRGVEKRVLTIEQINTMLRALDLRERLIASLATIEGMRPGEILALRFGDIDGECLWVRRRLYMGDIDSPKNRRSHRQVALSRTTRELISRWTEQSLLNGREAWIFPTARMDTPMRRDNIWSRHMLPKLKKIGLQWATFQVMRRTFASLSKKAGVDAHTRSAQMGNTVDVNENEYAVSSFEEKLKAVRKLEATVLQ